MATPSAHPPDWLGATFVLLGAALLAAKGVYAKLIYAEGVDYISLMAVRGALALPLFVAWCMSRSGLARLSGAGPGAVLAALFAGLVCFYGGGVIDFYALTLIDANLERVILFTYPAMVVVAIAVRRGKVPEANVLLGLALTFLGIVLAIGGVDAQLWRENYFGAGLVLICAVTYAAYFFANDYAGNRIGTRAFVFIVIVSSTIAIWLQFGVMHDIAEIEITPRAWYLLLMMTVTTTVAPVVLIADGVRRIGAQRGALLSTVGPPSTILLAAVFLGESLFWFQLVGMLAVLAGIYVIERRGIAPAPVGE